MAESPLLIAVMGATGTGKTAFINLASGSNLAVGRNLESCTDIVNVVQPFELDDRMVALVDTPGFDDNSKTDADVLAIIGQFLATTYEQGQKLAGVIYMHRISDFRMTGMSRRNFRVFRELCGDSTLKNIVIVTNMWGGVSKEIGIARESELARDDKFFKPVLEKGAQMLRHDNNAESAKNILRTIINNHPLPLQIQTEMVDKKDISQTAAGAEIHRELLSQGEKHEKEMKALQEEMKATIQAKDEGTRQRLQAISRQFQEETARLGSAAQSLSSEHFEERARMERELQELETYYRTEAEERRKAHEEHLSGLMRLLDAADEERDTLLGLLYDSE